MEERENISVILKTLPDRPGVYQFIGKDGKILYVGKAKSLRKRVSSYFTKERKGGRLAMLVKKTEKIEHIVVDTELDALLLENNLIKKYQPRYNVQLKDDKTFPWICIKKEPFPRVFSTRNVISDGSQYYGPYASVRMMNALLELIRQIYPLRNCSLRLSQKNIAEGKFRVCLEYHLGNCRGPCEGKQAEIEYDDALEGVRDLIRGRFGNVLNVLKQQMTSYAAGYEFEKAQALKEKIGLLERYQSKSMVVNPSVSDVDVYSIIADDETAYVNFLKVVSGSIIQAHTMELKKKLDEPEEDLLSLAIVDLRQRILSEAREIIVPIPLELELPGITFTVPRIGDKKKLLELSERNARAHRHEKYKQTELVDPERHSRRILSQMMKDLRMKELPKHIEGFDNSNFHGSEAVAAMVCFRDARPDKKEYRHYIIRTVSGPDDYASMQEVIYRRYRRLLDEGKPVPQLIVVDGGKGQLGSALASLEKLGLRGKVTVIGIAKKLEEIYYPGDPLPMYIDKKSETLKVLQRLRDEAHRFGITHHRSRREKSTLRTELTSIRGIGSETATKLLKAFRSVKAISNADMPELEKVVGRSKAATVYSYFHSGG